MKIIAIISADRRKELDMEYRVLGKTGLRVSPEWDSAGFPFRESTAEGTKAAPAEDGGAGRSIISIRPGAILSARNISVMAWRG